MRRLAILGPIVFGAGFMALLLPATMMLTLMGSDSSTGSMIEVSSCTVDDAGVSIDQLDDEQMHNAQIIIGVGQQLQVPTKGLVVAIAAAMQESGLRNLDYGDRDSLGLFQQRPSAGWGTPEQVTDPTYAANAFFTHLLAVPGWQDMEVTEAAQAVQRSAYPTAYAKWEGLADQVVTQLAGVDSTCQPIGNGPWVLPLNVPYVLTSPFGSRISPTTGLPDFHTGQDFAVPTGTPIVAASAGTVDFVGWDGGYGNLVRIQHADGIETYYAHQSKPLVTVGEQVQPGQVIGLSGATGNVTGPHLHFEVRVNGNPIDPVPFLQDKGLNP